MTMTQRTALWIVGNLLMLIAGVLMAPAVQRLLRWKRLPPVPEQVGGDCAKHDWANWSVPTPIEVHVFKEYGSDTRRDGLFQDRVCLRCNLYERRVT